MCPRNLPQARDVFVADFLAFLSGHASIMHARENRAIPPSRGMYHASNIRAEQDWDRSNYRVPVYFNALHFFLAVERRNRGRAEETKRIGGRFPISLCIPASWLG